MDFPVLGFEGGGGGGRGAGGGVELTSSDSATLAFSPFSSSNVAAEVNKNKWYGSTSLKQERTLEESQDDWKDPKIAKTSDYFSASKVTRYHTDNILFKDHQHQQMLSFSDNNSQMLSFPHHSSNCHSRIPGYVSEGMNAGIMHGMLPGMKGPFSPLQWMELEQQALIYKYITMNIPIPLPLLISIQKNLDNAAFSNYPGFRYNTLGWGGLNLGFSSRNDPEPGRCRRTDGKKWRCAKDAVVNHKYCERHMNRGRHRSRKLVEAGDKSGQSVPGNANGTSKLPENGSLNPLSKNASQIHGNIVPFEAGNNSDNNKLQHSLHLFGDGWTTNRPESSISDKTELSISIPKTPSDYMSTTSSPNNDKFGTFPLSLLPELEATHMGLGIGSADEHISGSWKTTVGGPLGEALHITTNGNGDGKGSSALNLMTGGWGSNSPPMASSPTGVLQKAAFGSVSNSSVRSSPESSRGGSICFNGLFGSTHLNSVFPGL